MGFLDELVCCSCSKSTGAGKHKGEDTDIFDCWLRDEGSRAAVTVAQQPRRGVERNAAQRGAGTSPADKGAMGGGTAEGSKPLMVTVMFEFEPREAEPFPPDPHGDLGVSPGDRLVVHPDKSQYGWCFCVSATDASRRGWVPGNYISVNGIDPYVDL